VKPFEYIPVQTIAEACDVLACYGADARVLAGGTDLLIERRRDTTKAPKVVLDISGVPELRGVDEADGAINIKPLTTHSELLCSVVLAKNAPLLAAAAAAIGAPQIRNRATVGGNIMNAAACADTVPPLVALGATVTLQSKGSRREVALAELFLKPYQTQAAPNELLTGIRFPKLTPDARSAFIKLGRRNALAISRMSVAVILRVDANGTITEARIVPGAAFPTWKRVPEAEQLLVGAKPSTQLFAAAGRKVSEEMIKATGRRWSTEYKEPVLAALVRRALEQCVKVGHALRCAPPEIGKAGASVTSSHAYGAQRSACPASEVAIDTTINGRLHTLTAPANLTLLDLLRDRLGLLGTKCGCEIGECGACTVLLDGEPVNSCLVLAPQIHGRRITTVEGLAQNGKLHPLQESFLDHDAVHCGFCTPGMLMSAKALLDWNPRATETDIRTAISGNLCRCTGYQQIVNAIAGARAVSGRARSRVQRAPAKPSR
jgi:xanthine dehydrogenase iron-sulfur cluster and FAD-binding subunit A